MVRVEGLWLRVEGFRVSMVIYDGFNGKGLGFVVKGLGF